MKYVFVVHSHSVFLTALGTIEYLKLNPQDIIVVYTRNYKTSFLPRGCTCFDASDVNDLAYKIYGCKRLIEVHRQLKFVDNKIKEWVGGKFELFLPHMGTPFFLIMHTHKLRTKTSLMQEGIISSSKWFDDKVSVRRKVKLLIKNIVYHGTLRFYEVPFWYIASLIPSRKKMDVYGISNNYFKFTSNYHEVKWQVPDIEFKDIIEGPVFVFDGFVKNYMSEHDYYIEQCAAAIKQFSAEQNYIKFHPNQSEEDRKTIMNYFALEKKQAVILDDSVPFEYYILKFHDLTIVGFGSSLLFLAHMMKDNHHQVICCDTWMLNSPLFKKAVEEGHPLYSKFFDDVEEVEKS